MDIPRLGANLPTPWMGVTERSNIVAYMLWVVVLAIAPLRAQREQSHERVASPYFDYVSFFFNKAWAYPAADIVSMMIKLADANTGVVTAKSIRKPLTDADKARLDEGVALCTETLRRLGVAKERTFLGTLNAGHPGGGLPLTPAEAETMHHARLPSNLFVADATLIPRALGGPPILTIIALAKRVAKVCRGEVLERASAVTHVAHAVG